MTLPTPTDASLALVTGASSGIGQEIARELGRRGHRVGLVARRVPELTAFADELAALAIRADVLPTDLGDPDARAALPERVAALGAHVSILVNAAGFSTLGAVARSDPAAERAMIEVDVMAVVDLCSRFLPSMVERAAGAVLNVASTGAFQPVPGQAGYGASKAFVLSYSQALAGELAGTGVTATVLCPGPVDTGFGAAAGFSKEDADASLPRMLWKSAADVARAGVHGLDHGRVVVVPGAANRVGAVFAQLTPTGPLVKQLARRHPGLRD
jgi:short-subunit dehydrogenase